MSLPARRPLEDLLDSEIEAARALASALAAERAALVGTSPDAVHERVADKLRLLGALEKIEGERRALWGPVDSRADPTAPVAGRWRALMELMAGCRTANEVNGRIIHVRQSQIRQLLDIVRGGPPITYGPQGKTFTRALRPLARA